MLQHDSAGVEIVQYRQVPETETWRIEDEPLVSVGLLDGPDPYLFSNVGHVRLLPDDRLLVTDLLAREIRLFDPDGGFLERFGGRGEGPGEFRSLSALRLHEDTVRLWDAGLGRVTLFTTGGELLQSLRPEIVEIEAPLYVQDFFADGDLLALMGEQDAPDMEGGLVRTNQALVRWDAGAPNRLDTLASMPVADVFVASDGMVRPIPLTPGGAWVAGDDVLYLTDGRGFEYRIYADGGELRRIMRVDEQPVPIDSDYLQAYIARRVEGAPEGVRAGRRLAYEEMPFPDHFPVIDDMFLDDVGNVWLHRYDPPATSSSTSSPAHVWHGFDGGGGAMAVLQVPAAFTLLDVDEGRAVGVWEEADGAPMVQVYRIRRE